MVFEYKIINESDINDEYYTLCDICLDKPLEGMTDKHLNNSEKKVKNSDTSIMDAKSEKMYLIKNLQTESDDPNISEFVKFCIKNGLFDNTFYDYKNNFSIMATKLDSTYFQMSNDDEFVNKKTFIQEFKKKHGYKGNINFIYKCIDNKNVGKISYDEFIEFFLPYVKYITV